MGFFSFSSIGYFLANDIDYSIPLDHVLTYRERGIRYSRVDVTEKMKRIISFKEGRKVLLYLYEDVKLRGEEKSNRIILLRTRRIKGYDATRQGKVSILSRMDMDSETIYNIYNGRENVEQSFDEMKNELEEDKTYLQDDESIWGYLFVAFLSLYQQYYVLSLIMSKDPVGRLSVNEVLLQLSRVYKVRYADGATGFLGIPRKLENIIEALDLDILPKC